MKKLFVSVTSALALIAATSGITACSHDAENDDANVLVDETCSLGYGAVQSYHFTLANDTTVSLTVTNATGQSLGAYVVDDVNLASLKSLQSFDYNSGLSSKAVTKEFSASGLLKKGDWNVAIRNSAPMKDKDGNLIVQRVNVTITK